MPSAKGKLDLSSGKNMASTSNLAIAEGVPQYMDDHGSADYKEAKNTSERSSSEAPEIFQAIQRGHIDVKRAEAEFLELNKELNLELKRSRSNQYSKLNYPDLEKSDNSIDSDELFDLETTLRGNQEAAAASGIKSKQIGIMWSDLNVYGVGGVKNFVRTFPHAIVSFFNVFSVIVRWLGIGKKGRVVNILQNFRGVIKPGEMVLVLGRPGSGCTSFLKVIANQRDGYTNVSGKVFYGPFDHNTFAKRYRGEAVYNMEDETNSMYPTLTVGQTLAFALDCKIPGTRPAGLTRRDFKERVIDMLLKMFNIEHTRNTMVGGAFVRGVSGGERKRVSIAEMMVTNACVCAWDGPTKGLDASTAVDYIRSIRILSNIHKVSTFVSGYQLSESIYREFDKVLVIDQGRQVYFGPASEARGYFESLGFLEKPRQTTADYLTGCTDPHEREYKSSVAGQVAPRTPEELADAFTKSAFSARLEAEMTAYSQQLHDENYAHEEFLLAVKQSKRYTSPGSIYSIPFWLQIWVILKRQAILKWQDKFSLTVSWTTSMTIAIVVSTMWLHLPQTSQGAFTRGGVLFISLLFNSFQAFGELVGALAGRPVLAKQSRVYAFYQPAALWIAQICVDLCYQSVQILCFCIMVYFSTGLVREPGAFFSYVIIIVSAYLCQALMFRTIAIICKDFDVSIRLASTCMTILILNTGYLIQWNNGQVWFRWLFYIDALGLGFSALMMNEFKRLDLTCSGKQLIPYGREYNDIDHQVCTLLGSRPGSAMVSGTDYINATYSYDPKDQWIHYALMICIIIFFLCMNVTLGEFVKGGTGGNSLAVFARPSKERTKLNAALRQRRESRSRGDNDNFTAELGVDSKSVLTWEALNYDVPVPSGQKRILSDVYGFVKPGELTALMGASGAGKTTLLDVLAARKNIGVISGQIFVDGTSRGRAFQRGTAYAEQIDVLEPTQTVREALRFSADLRQPYATSQEQKYSYVEDVIALLELEDLADAIIGEPENGLSPPQRKLVTIGVELAARPQLLLFLDEPTSGLDSQSAWNIARFLRKLAASGQAILCTIHQPNSALFQQFDRLLLLQRGGQCVYFGEIGKDASTIISYFRRNGADCPPDANPAEWMLDAIGAGLARRLGHCDWAETWNKSPEFTSTKEEIIRLNRAKTELQAPTAGKEQKEYATPMWHQLKTVVRRQSISYWRSPSYGFTRLYNHIAIALLAGLCFHNLGHSRSSVQSRVFVIFQITVLPALILAQVGPKYALARSLSYREQAAKAYKDIPFVISMVIAEIPYNLICAVCFFCLIYYIPGLQKAPSRAGYQFLMVLVTESFAVSLGQMIAALTPSPKIAALFNPPVMITFSQFSGVTIPRPQMPKFWRSWLYQLDPFTRLIGGMMVTELHDLQVTCAVSELQTFTAPNGQTCGQYMTEFFANGGPGYIASNSSSECQYCPYKVGDQYYEPLGYSFSHRWRDLGILAGFTGSNILILLLAAKLFKFNKR